VIDHQRFHDLFDSAFVGGFRYYPRLRMAPRSQQRDGSPDIAALFLYRTRFSEHLDYLKMFLRSVREGSGGVRLAELPRHAAAVLATAWPLALRYFRDRRSFKPRDAEVSLVLNCEQLPTMRSRILLADERDPLGMRRLRIDWQIDGRELQGMRRFAQIVRDELGRQGLARVEIDPALEAGAPAFLGRVQDAVHQMGTTRIGRDRDHGAVDADLRVFDIENLYVAGAAVFPSTGFANPTFTAIALGLRLAQHLTGRPTA
jgi:choline dehydrogenase-like flavoprotein